MSRTFDRPDGRISYVRNRSSRHGAVPRGIVIHTTESHNRDGRSDVDAIHAWFNNPRSQASSHVIVDAEGHSTTCVPDAEKAWTQSAYNSQCLSIELIGHAAQTAGDWGAYDLRKAAKFAAFWCREYSIPVRRGKCDNQHAAITVPGLFGHADFGAAGGGHTDPGGQFPWDRFLKHVRYYRTKGWVQ